MKQSLLDKINSPQDVKALRFEELATLAQEVRVRLISTVSRTGGHLASNLGVVELTIALHRVFDSPTDAIVFDVGHQCYTHKLLTGRAGRFHTLRQQGGLSGFPKRGESAHDGFIAGHSSTSISAAMGIARAKLLQRQPGKAIAVIGDGAFSGVAFEALNGNDESLQNLIVILNDNEMSISKNVSAFARHLARIRNTKGYYDFKDSFERTLRHIPLVGNPLRLGLYTVKSAAKNVLYHSNLFEDMGFIYLGPVDGHDLTQLCATFARARALQAPVLVHVHTRKGKGYRQAEENPGMFHGVSKFDPYKRQTNDLPADSFSEQAGLCLMELGERDKRVVAVTAAMKYATGLHHFSTRFREEGRFFDVGIAESHAVVFSSAMAANGLLPVFAVYSSFLQRAYDQLLHDCSLEPTHVVLAVDRAGLVGEDGETHQGVFDVPMLTTLPGVAIYSPASYDCLRSDLSRALFEEKGLVAVRYPKGRQLFTLPQGVSPGADFYQLGDAQEQENLLITYGRIVFSALKAVEMSGKPYRVLLLDKIFPIPAAVITAACGAGRVVFVEESSAVGGIGERLDGLLLARGFGGQYIHKAIENPVVPQGTMLQCIEGAGLSPEGIAAVL